MAEYTFRAAGAITIGQAVVITTAGTVDHTGAVTDITIGVALSAAAAAGDYVTVQLSGVTEEAICVASAAITAGARVTGDAAGAITALGTAAAQTYGVLGVAVDSAAGAGSTIRVNIKPQSWTKPAAA